VVFSFFAALAIGVGALLTTVFMSTVTALAFTLVFDVFYTFFAIRFINYPELFYAIEQALPENCETEDVKNITSDPANFAALEQRVRQWVDEKRFTETGITINALVPHLRTNRHYLSRYINTCQGMTFREWINGLKIEEAKSLMRREPELTVNEVALRVGFTDKSNFIRTFTGIEGLSPKAWQRQKLSF
jgi:AraC-like DNA-binding protein